MKDLNWKNVIFFAYLHICSAYALFKILTLQVHIFTIAFGKS